MDGMMGVAFTSFTLSGPWAECFLFFKGGLVLVALASAASFLTNPLLGSDPGAFSGKSLSVVSRYFPWAVLSLVLG